MILDVPAMGFYPPFDRFYFFYPSGCLATHFISHALSRYIHTYTCNAVDLNANIRSNYELALQQML